MSAPLAQRLRPQTIDDIVGQKHLLGEGKPLRNIILSGELPNMVFYGPSGVGKTTLASIIAKTTDRHLVKLNGTTASTADIKDVVAKLNTFVAPNGILLYLDSVFQQKAAADTARIHRKRRHNAYSFNDREPVFLYLQRDSQPLDRV